MYPSLLEGLQGHIQFCEIPVNWANILLDLWEEIGDDTIEEFQIILKELGHVDVSDRPQYDQFLKEKTNKLITWRK